MTRGDGFYVGYLPLPGGHARFLRAFVPILGVVLGATALLLAAAQRDPGAGVWEGGEARTWTGTLVARPYPLLLEKGSGEAYLLVEVGKRGPRAGLGDLHGQGVTLSGWLLHREGRSMIELEPGDAGVVAAGGEAAPTPAIEAGGETAVLEGEILDSKCYLGAMKPGDGKSHKACATLCVRGGVPPMLFARAPGGALRTHLLVLADGSPANAAVLEYLGEPVAVRGRVGRVGSVDVFVLDEGGVWRR